MSSDYRIHLNFLPVVGHVPPFRVFRKLRADGDSRPDPAASSYSLPTGDDVDNRAYYWIKFDPADGYQEHRVRPEDNNDLTRWAIFHALRATAAKFLRPEQFDFDQRRFLDEIRFVMAEHAEGHEMLVLQPYRLRETKQFGCLADFHFTMKPGVPYSRRVQQLSLSLNRQFKRNLDCYLDRFGKIQAFLKERVAVLTALPLPGADATIDLGTGFVSLDARRLRSKSYVFAANRESKSQFTGLREFGPLQSLDAPPHLLFLFREQDRVAARTLVAALRGSKDRSRFGFPGFQALFKSDLTIDSDPIVLPNLTDEAMADALKEVQSRRATNPNTLPILVLPEGDDNGYMAHKADFSHAGIPTQVCTLKVIQDDYALKWAIANIALQIFCKAGGQPWKVRPTAERTLIIGISQSHKAVVVDGERRIDKYFAFTVMTDNSGVFQRIQVLGEGGDKGQYLRQLRQNLTDILADGSQKFSRVVLHTSFKLKKDEIDAICKTVTEAAGDPAQGGCKFAVIKVNHKSRFFGINRQVNSLVPFEGTCVRLGFGEYLAWFEGIFPDKTTVAKPYPGPTHLNFLRVQAEGEIADDDLLQDIINLSGANWRGFNAKGAPVSVFYCHLVADRVHDFHERGLPLPEVPLIRPWFL